MLGDVDEGGAHVVRDGGEEGGFGVWGQGGEVLEAEGAGACVEGFGTGHSAFAFVVGFGV